jgi:hypothetical protein
MVTGGRGLRRTARMDNHTEPIPAPVAVPTR